MDRQRLETALRNAHAAGDLESARKIASLLTQADAPAPVDGSGSIVDSLGQGVTFGWADELTGAAGATVNSAMNLFGKGTGESWGDAYEGIRDAARYNEEAFRTRNPKTALAAEMTGALLTGGAGAARAGVMKGANTLRKTAAVGAAEGAAYGAGASAATGALDIAKDTATGAGIGAATGLIIPAVANKVGSTLRRSGESLQPGQTIEATAQATGNTTSRYANDVQRLRNADVQLTTGQQTGSQSVKAFETTVDKTLVGGALNKTFDRQRQQFQTQLMRMAGFPDEVAQTGLITDDALEAAGRHLSKKYSAALQGKAITLGDDFLDVLGSMEQKHSRLTTLEQRRDVRVVIDDFLNEVTSGPVSGERYQELRGFVGGLERKNQRNNPKIADLYRDLKLALDDAFVRASGSSNRDLNIQYAQFKQLEKAYRSGGGTQVAQGVLPLASMNRVAKQSPGSREWRQFINAASAVLGDATPNSGTASRLANIAVAGTGGIPAFIANHATARGVGGTLPEAVRRGLTHTGTAVQNAGRNIGAAGAPVIMPAVMDDKQRIAMALAQQSKKRPHSALAEQLWRNNQ